MANGDTDIATAQATFEAMSAGALAAYADPLPVVDVATVDRLNKQSAVPLINAALQLSQGIQASLADKQAQIDALSARITALGG